MSFKARLALLACLLLLVLAGAPYLGRLVQRRPELRLQDYESTVYSQGGEDGIIEKLFELIPPTSRYAIEFGAGDGQSLSNVCLLITRHGWRGLLIEGDARQAAALRQFYLDYPGVRTAQAWVFPANVELLFEEHGVPRDLDLLVIDIDSNDYYVWHAIREFRPKVVMIEYNGMFAPPVRMVIDFHPAMYWSGRDAHFGASLQSMYELGKSKGYELVGTNSLGVNAFFVERSYYSRFGIKDNSPARLYHRYLGSQFETSAVLAGAMPPPAHDLVLPERPLAKRFRFDR
jgi:hypothetical protein